MVKIYQHIKFQANPSMHSPANARKPLRTDGRTDGRTDRRTDGRTCRKTVTVGQVDQRTHVQVKRGYFRLRTDGRTDGQPENIMPPAPKGGGITTLYQTYLRKNTFKITTKSSDVAYLPPLWRHASLLNDGSYSFTHPVVKGRSARGTSSGT